MVKINQINLNVNFACEIWRQNFLDKILKFWKITNEWNQKNCQKTLGIRWWVKERLVNILIAQLLYKVLSCRGQLVQWENVRLQIQRSEFASCLRQMVLLSRVFKSTHIYGTVIYRITHQRKSESAIYWKRKQSSILPCMKRNVPTNWPYDITSKKVEWRHTTPLRNSSDTSNLLL